MLMKHKAHTEGALFSSAMHRFDQRVCISTGKAVEAVI